MYEANDEDYLQRWAIEQVIALHRGSSLSMDAIITEAKKLIAFVKDSQDE